MKKLLAVLAVAALSLFGAGIHDGHAAVTTQNGTVASVLVGGGGGGAYPRLGSPCLFHLATGICIDSTGNLYGCKCVYVDICGIPTLIWVMRPIA